MNPHLVDFWHVDTSLLHYYQQFDNSLYFKILPIQNFGD